MRYSLYGTIFVHLMNIEPYMKGGDTVIKFEIGKTYLSTSWFTGGTLAYTCVSRDEEKITFNVRMSELDGNHKGDPETFAIEKKNGVECVRLCEYHGNPHFLAAGEMD